MAFVTKNQFHITPKLPRNNASQEKEVGAGGNKQARPGRVRGLISLFKVPRSLMAPKVSRVPGTVPEEPRRLNAEVVQHIPIKAESLGDFRGLDFYAMQTVLSFLDPDASEGSKMVCASKSIENFVKSEMTDEDKVVLKHSKKVGSIFDSSYELNQKKAWFYESGNPLVGSDLSGDDRKGYVQFVLTQMRPEGDEGSSIEALYNSLNNIASKVSHSEFAKDMMRDLVSSFVAEQGGLAHYSRQDVQWLVEGDERKDDIGLLYVDRAIQDQAIEAAEVVANSMLTPEGRDVGLERVVEAFLQNDQVSQANRVSRNIQDEGRRGRFKERILRGAANVTDIRGVLDIVGSIPHGFVEERDELCSGVVSIMKEDAAADGALVKAWLDTISDGDRRHAVGLDFLEASKSTDAILTVVKELPLSLRKDVVIKRVLDESDLDIAVEESLLVRMTVSSERDALVMARMEIVFSNDNQGIWTVVDMLDLISDIDNREEKAQSMIEALVSLNTGGSANRAAGCLKFIKDPSKKDDAVLKILEGLTRLYHSSHELEVSLLGVIQSPEKKDDALALVAECVNNGGRIGCEGMARSFVKQIQDPVKKERVQDKFARIELKELAWTLVRVVNGRLNKEIKESVTAPDWAVRWDSELKSNEETKNVS